MRGRVADFAMGPGHHSGSHGACVSMLFAEQRRVVVHDDRRVYKYACDLAQVELVGVDLEAYVCL